MRFDNIESFIYNTDKNHSKRDAKFIMISDRAKDSHRTVKRRYRKFMKLNKLLGKNINKDRVNNCCGVVKDHLHELHAIRKYLIDTGQNILHPIFMKRLDGWIQECDGMHKRYKHHISILK